MENVQWKMYNGKCTIENVQLKMYNVKSTRLHTVWMV